MQLVGLGQTHREVQPGLGTSLGHQGTEAIGSQACIFSLLPGSEGSLGTRLFFS